MADTAIGLALRSQLRAGLTHRTAQLNVHFLAKGAGSELVGRGRALHLGERMGYGESEVLDTEGQREIATRKHLSIRELIVADRSIQSEEPKRVLLAYAQSWALLYMLLQEEPDRTRVYCKLIYPQRVSERRLADFQQAFGSDLARLELRHAAYVKNLVQQHAPGKP